MNIGPEYPSYEVPTENLRFEEIPPEIADMMENAEETPADAMMAELLSQLLGDVESLTVRLEYSNDLLTKLHKSMSALDRDDYPAQQMSDFLRGNEALLKQIAETYVPAVDNGPEKG